MPVLQEIIKRVLIFMWAYASEPVREDHLALFKKAGVNWLCLGIGKIK